MTTTDDLLKQQIELLQRIRYVLEQQKGSWGFPATKDWDNMIDKIYNVVVPAGGKQKLWTKLNESGYVISGIGVMDNPYLIMTLHFDMAEESMSIEESFRSGLRDLGVPGMNVVQYDTVLSLYTFYYDPYQAPGDPYKWLCYVEVSNPTNVPITIYYGEITRIRINPIGPEKTEKPSP
jgi:hypothetical protein